MKVYFNATILGSFSIDKDKIEDQQFIAEEIAACIGMPLEFIDDFDYIISEEEKED